MFKLILLLVIASTSLAQKYCEDNEIIIHCQENKDKCSDPAWMPPCMDLNKNCALAAKVCNEPSFIEYMTERCPITCGKC
ncbi:hypothetical protein FO519_004786 [Halicephalobus sp. NKZ332]|nr:hypothetical protein FO519_004786 [Halicephalobus sp. NKZ332]